MLINFSNLGLSYLVILVIFVQVKVTFQLTFISSNKNGFRFSYNYNNPAWNCYDVVILLTVKVCSNVLFVACVEIHVKMLAIKHYWILCFYEYIACLFVCFVSFFYITKYNHITGLYKVTNIEILSAEPASRDGKITVYTRVSMHIQL